MGIFFNKVIRFFLKNHYHNDYDIIFKGICPKYRESK